MHQTNRLSRRAPTLAIFLCLLSGCVDEGDGTTAEEADRYLQAETVAPPTTRGEDQPPDVLGRRVGTVAVTNPPTTAPAPTTPPTEAPPVTEGLPVTEPTPVTEPAPTSEVDSQQAPPEPPPTSPPAPPTDEQPPPTTDPRSKVGYFIEMTNQLHAGVGLAPLQVSGPLTHSAGLQAEHMAATNTLAHQDLQDELTQGWMLVGENVGYGPTAESVFQALVNSPGHYNNMVSSGFTHAGMATRWDDAGRLWVAQVFGG